MFHTRAYRSKTDLETASEISCKHKKHARINQVLNGLKTQLQIAMAQATDDESTDDERNYSSPLHNTDPVQPMSPYGIGMANDFGGEQDKHNNPYSNKSNPHGYDPEDMKDDDGDDDDDEGNGDAGFNSFQNDSPDTPEIDDDDNNGYENIANTAKTPNTCQFH